MDTQLTLRLFKMACLAYSPSEVNYRGMTLDRKQMIMLRRGLVDRVTNLMPTCDLFKDHAIYPRRYFDDLMIEENFTPMGNQSSSPRLAGDQSSPVVGNLN
mmetsp:Transcript_12122/g.18745  ORF Transcript_12122/g.18745 Transcript_12122/m.18745 type:complete len:101 (+) Transcript_12122:1141-1443(+)